MTREQARNLLTNTPMIQKYVEGSTIQNRSHSGAQWEDLLDPVFTEPSTNYRIKPTPKLRPFRRGEIKCGDVVKAKKSGNYFFVSGESDLGILIGFGWVTYEALLDDYTMADGSPCGKEEEE